MFDILASTYITASRMDHWLEQDFMHRDPRTAARLRHIHGLTDPTIRRAFRGRIGWVDAIERPYKPSRVANVSRKIVARLGATLRRSGEWLEEAAHVSCRQRKLADTP